MQTRPRRRNPSGSRGLRPHPLSLVVGGHPGQPSPRSSTATRKPRLRGLREFLSTLLKVAEADARRYLMTRKVLSQRVLDSALNPVAVSDADPGTPA